MKNEHIKLKIWVTVTLILTLMLCCHCSVAKKVAQNTEVEAKKSNALEEVKAQVSLIEKTKETIQKVDTDFFLSLIPSRTDTIYSHHTEYIEVQKPNGEVYKIPRMAGDKLELGAKDKSQIEVKDWSKEFAQMQAKITQQSNENLQLKQSLKTESKTSTTSFYWVLCLLVLTGAVLAYMVFIKGIRLL